MGWQVIIAPSAQSDLADIVRYIATHNPDAAVRLGFELIAKAEALADHPEIGRMVPEFRTPDNRPLSREAQGMLNLSRANDRAANAEWLGSRGLQPGAYLTAPEPTPTPPTAQESAESLARNPIRVGNDFGALANSPRPGRLGSQVTQDHIRDVASTLQDKGWEITGGGGVKPEEYIPGPGNARRGSSYPDITAEKNAKTLRVNTVDTRADGVTPSTREANNAARIRIQKPNDTLILIPKPSE